VSAARRTALVSIAAAVVLLALKLTVGLEAHSLGLVSEAVHSGTDLIAALLTYLALGVSGRPADQVHQYGHGKAEHLAALGEAAALSVVSVLIAARALERLLGSGHQAASASWYVLATVIVVIVVDASRATVSWRAAASTGSAALASNALHFASDLAGSLAVLVGLLFVRAGHPSGDSYAALFVAILVLAAAGRLMRANVDVLMDRATAVADAAARAAIATLAPTVELRRLRMREAGGRQFADVVIGVAASAPVGAGHAAADAVEAVLEQALPGSDVVVHVEPLLDARLGERARAAAASVPGAGEIHSLRVVDLNGRNQLSLHLKMPGGMPLEQAHEVAEAVEAAICAAVPEVDAVQSHLEPLSESASGQEVAGDVGVVERVVLELTGTRPLALRFMRTDAGLIAFLTLGLAGTEPLSLAHTRASEIETAIRRELPEIVEVIVHTEPLPASELR
jgi:cation diffusion facilitator family transporter